MSNTIKSVSSILLWLWVLVQLLHSYNDDCSYRIKRLLHTGRLIQIIKAERDPATLRRQNTPPFIHLWCICKGPNDMTSSPHCSYTSLSCLSHAVGLRPCDIAPFFIFSVSFYSFHVYSCCCPSEMAGMPLACFTCHYAETLWLTLLFWQGKSASFMVTYKAHMRHVFLFCRVFLEHTVVCN